MNFDEIIQKNSAKSAKKLEKMKENQEKLNAYANMNTKNILLLTVMVGLHGQLKY